MKTTQREATFSERFLMLRCVGVAALKVFGCVVKDYASDVILYTGWTFGRVARNLRK